MVNHTNIIQCEGLFVERTDFDKIWYTDRLKWIYYV